MKNATLLLFSVLLLIAISACGESSDSNDDLQGDTDEESDGDEDSAGEIDTDTDQPDTDSNPHDPFFVSEFCKSDMVSNAIFEIDPAGGNTQIHAAVAFDGAAVWVAYSIPDSMGTFDIMLTRIHCNGTRLVEPFRVNTIDFNDLDPAIAILEDKIVVVWQTDNGSGERNLDIHFNMFYPNGVPYFEEDATFQGTGSQGIIDANNWMPKVASLPDNGFALTGSWAPSDAERWQAFVQRYDYHGETDGLTIRPDLLSDHTQLYPDIAASVDGSIAVAWNASDDDEGNWAMFTRIPADSDEPSMSPAMSAFEEEGGGVAVAFAEDTANTGYIAMHDDKARSNVLLGLIDSNTGSSSYLEFGKSSKIDHSPQIAPTADGGAVAWYRVIGGIRNDLFIQRFRNNNGELEMIGEATKVNVEAVAPYAPAVCAVNDDLFFLSWAQGTSPDFRLYGTYVMISEHSIEPATLSIY